MQKFQNILSLSPNQCGPLRDTKTSKYFSQSCSWYNSEKLIRTLYIWLVVVFSQYFQQILTKRQYSLTELSFQGSYISLFQESNANFHLTSYISWCPQTFIKKLFVGQCTFTHILFSRMLYKFPLKLVVQCLLKNCI